MSSPTPPRAITRRGFLAGAAAGLAAGIPATWFAARHFPGLSSTPSFSPAPSSPNYAMPGPYPGRVIEVRHPGSVSRDHVINPSAVDAMIDRGMAELTGTEPADIRGTWGTLFEKGDVVGIKVNPVGRKPRPGEGRVAGAVGSISSFEVLDKVIRSLRAVGIPDRDIVVFERYANEFAVAGYADLMGREYPRVRWCASSLAYSNEQVNIAGFDQGRDVGSPELTSRVVGYDPDVFTTMGYCHPDHDKEDDRRFRSHLSLIVTRMVNKVITLPVLKDHRSAGVTLALKNLSHGMNNNVARSHLDGIAHGVGIGERRVQGPNQCNTFIPQAVSHHLLRQKATLHILDGLIGVYEGGPGNWNATWGTWRHRGLFFATDPVALDHVGWDLIDARRARMGWPAVEMMGRLYHTPGVDAGTALAPLGGENALGCASLASAAVHRDRGRATEVFNVRQPEHITLAGQLGLGVFPAEDIDYRRINLPVSEPEA